MYYKLYLQRKAAEIYPDNPDGESKARLEMIDELQSKGFKEHKAGVTRDEADILVEWAKECGINYHEPMIHHGRGGIWGLVEHIKIFNIHIPIIEIEDTV